MTYANYDDATSQMLVAGLLLPGGAIEIDTTRPVRCLVDGGGHEKRGWYWLNEKEIRGERYITGAFGVYQGNDNGKQVIKLNLDGKALALSAEERAAIKARHDSNMKRAAALRKAEADRAAAMADRAWRKYLPVGESDYLKRKGVGAHGLRFSPSGNGTVAIPMLREGKIAGLQIIRGKNRTGPDGKPQREKDYWPAGMNKVGAFHQLGRVVRGGVCVVAEGYATAASIFEALGQTVPVAVAFDAGSLMPAAQSIAKAYRTTRLLIAADDDRIQRCRECKHATAVDLETCVHCHQPHGAHNPGIEAAQNAAHAVGGAWIAPKFSVERANDAKGPNDFNDLHASEGLHVVRQQLDTHLAGLGWSASAPVARMPAAEGAGGDNQGGGEGRSRLVNMVDIDTACERWSIVYGGKGTLFDHEEHCLVPKGDVLDLLPEHGWRDWKNRESRQIVRLSEVGFDPAETDPNIRCNLWGGWPTVPKEGKCERLLDVLEHLCAEERNSREIYHWVLKWLAFPIQNPGAKMRTALIFHGPQGVGKNLFFEAVMRIYAHYGRIVDQAAVEDKFNDWLSGRLFLIADEVVARNELFHLKNKLKGIVTGEWIRINPKNVAAHDEKNHVNLVFLSNERQPLVLEKDDRRYVVVWTPEKMDRTFYDQVKEEIAGGGIEALHHYLLHLDLAGFNEFTDPPITQSKRDLIDVSLDSIERFMRDWLSGDIRFNDTVLPFCPCGSDQLYRSYKRWCVHEGVARPREQAAFIGHLAKLHGWVRGHKDRYSNEGYTGATIRQRFIIPSEADMARAATVPGSIDYRNDTAKTQAQWLTNCFFAFDEATRGQE